MGTGEISRIAYIGIEFLGYMCQSIPIVVLLYAPFKEEQLRWDRRRFLSIFYFAMVVSCLAAAVYLGTIYTPGFTREDFVERHILVTGNHMFNMMGLAATIVFMLSFKKGTKGRLFIYLIVLQYALTVYTITESMARFIVVHSAWLGPYGVEGAIIYLIVAILFVPLLYHGLKKYGRGYISNQNQKSLRAISVCSFIVLLTFLVFTIAQNSIHQVNISAETERYISLWWICTLIIAVVIYFIYFFMLHEESKKEEMMVQMAVFEIQYQSMAEKIQEEKRTHHNIRHHFRTLATLLEDGNYEEAKNYLQKYVKEWEAVTMQKISRNPMINGVLEYYFSQAKEKGIQIKTKIDVKESYPFDMMDMTVLFGNAMENAIEACEKSGLEERFIHISICQRKKALLIQIENSCEDTILAREKDGKSLPKSSKKGRVMGYGLSSIAKVVEKYQGEMDFWKQENVFTLQMMLNIPEDE